MIKLNDYFYTTFKSYLIKHFGKKMGKIGLTLGYPCPQKPACLFCNQSSFIPTSLAGDGSITEQINKALPYLSRKYQTDSFIPYFQENTSTAVPLDVLAEAVTQTAAFDEIKVVSFSTRPDYIDDEILDVIQINAKGKQIWIELGMQSANDNTLIRIGRGHSFAVLENAVKVLHRRNIPCGLQIIIGLPGENRVEVLHTFKEVNRLNPDFCKIHQLQVVKGSRLVTEYLLNRYRGLEISEYIELLSEGLALLNENISITRILADAHLDELIVLRWNLS